MLAFYVFYGSGSHPELPVLRHSFPTRPTSGPAASVEALPMGARVGTASPRRAAQLLALRPDLKIGLFRGNVATRLKKLAEGEADATLLAARSEEQTSELQSLMSSSYAVFCLKKNNIHHTNRHQHTCNLMNDCH